MGGRLREEFRRLRPHRQEDRDRDMQAQEGKMRRAGKDGYRLLYAGMLFVIVCSGAGRSLGITAFSAVHILTGAAVLLLCVGLQRFTAKGRILCVFLTAVFFGVLTAALGTAQCGLFFRSWLQWLAGRDGWNWEWRMGYELLQTGLLALVCYGLQFVLERYLVLRVLTADLLVSLLLFCLLTEWEVPHMAVVFVLCYIVMVYVEWIQREWIRTRSGDRKRSMLWIMPFIALYFVLLFCMPVPEKPYEWQFVKETCSRIGESFIGLTQKFLQGGGDDFDTAFSGFSEEGDLQDETRENSRVVMAVQGTRSLVTNVYLTGKIYDTFDGQGWTQEYHGQDGEEDDGLGFRDAEQLQKAVREYDAAHLAHYLSAATLQIRYRSFRTSCLFAPLQTRKIRMPREQAFAFRDGDNLLFREKKGYGTAYETEYYQINAGAESFDRFLRAAINGTDGPKAPAADAAGFGKADAATARTEGSALAEASRRERIYEVYTEEVALSDRTRQYLEEVTAGAEDPLERLRRIEGALSSFTYTRQPEKLPAGLADGGAFLEYFLLEGQEGYCTHFATAFVLLARAQGFPARYVQGFCVPVRTSAEVPVYGDMAHAWPEVYFDGVGWIPFEPTPGYGQLRYTPWETEEGDGNITAAYGKSAQKTAGTAAAESVPEEVPAETEAAADPRVRRFLTVLGRAFLAACVTGCIVLALQRILRRRRYRRMDATGKLRMEVSVNLRILGFLGLRREEGETLQEFRERAAGSEALRTAGGCSLWCIEAYEEILYGEKDAVPEMVETAVRERKELMAALRERKRWRYFLFRCRLAV